MRITDLLKQSAIELNVSVANKQAAIDKLVSLHDKSGNLVNAAEYKKGILAREEMGTTAVGMEVAIPHAKSTAVKAPALAAITVPNGVNYDAPDGQPCKLIFMIAATTDGDVHLEVLARLMQLLMHEDFTAKLKAAKTPKEFISIIDAKETEKFPDEPKAEVPAKKGYRVLAITACPTGIAHTYMAAESLQKAGDSLNIPIKVETNGSGGAKNVLTEEEIANCDGIIIAADITINLARFDGKPVLQCAVSDGIHKPEELINKIVNKEVPVYHHKGGSADAPKKRGGAYGHLMNGVSHMLPFVVAGGIFIAIAFLIDIACGVNAQEAGSTFGTVTPAAAWFKTLGGVAFNLMVPILSGFIAMSIADRPGLLVGLVGGFLATSGATFADPGAVNTVPSGFLGGLLAGFAGGYLMLAIEKMCDKMPKALEGIKPVLIYPLLGLGGILVVMCAVNPFMGMINSGMSDGLNAIASNPAMMVPLCALLAGMMSIDMGGPFNKAAYAFATLNLANADDQAYIIMAAVMIGGMVPPIAIALSNTFFKNRWTDEERKNAPVNYVMGLSFITEGAIPYAAGHPLQVIPSCIVGSAVAGAFSALFGCKLMAPHGGIFVFATMQGTWYFYLLALAIGAVVSMFMLALLKKPLNREIKKVK